MSDNSERQTLLNRNRRDEGQPQRRALSDAAKSTPGSGRGTNGSPSSNGASSSLSNSETRRSESRPSSRLSARRAKDTWEKSQDALRSKLPACLDQQEAYMAYMEAKERRIKELAEVGQIFEWLDSPFLNGVCALLMRTVLYVIVVAILAFFMTLLVHGIGSDEDDSEAGSGSADGVSSNRDQTIHDLTNNVVSDNALTAVSTAVAFLVVTRLQTNVAQNRQIYELFFAICGTTAAITIECRAFAPHLNSNTLSPAGRDLRLCNKIARVLASIPYALIEKFRYGDEFHTTEKLWEDVFKAKKMPLFDVPHVPDEQRAYTGTEHSLFMDCERVQKLKLPLYESLLLLLTMYVNSMEKEGVAPPKVGFLAGNIRALTADEGTITGLTGFERPTAVTTLMYFVLLTWYVLLLLTDLVPNNKWHSIYLMSVIGISTIGFYALAEEIKNPFSITTLGIPFMGLKKTVAGPSSINQQRVIAVECSKTEGVVMTILGSDVGVDELYYGNRPTLYAKPSNPGSDQQGTLERRSLLPLLKPVPGKPVPGKPMPGPPPIPPDANPLQRGLSSPKPPQSLEPAQEPSVNELSDLITSGGLLLTSRWCTGGRRQRRLGAIRE